MLPLIPVSFLLALRFQADYWIDDYPKIIITKNSPEVINVRWENFPNQLELIQIWTSNSPNSEEIPRWKATNHTIFPKNTLYKNTTLHFSASPKNYVACSSKFHYVKEGTSRTYTNLPCYEWAPYHPRDNTRKALRFDEGGWGFLFVLLYSICLSFIVCGYCVTNHRFNELDEYYYQKQVHPLTYV